MSKMTQTEKNYWIGRMNELFQVRIDQLHAEKPSLEKKLRDKAQQLAIKELGIAKLQTEVVKTEKAYEDARKKKQKAQEALEQHILDMKIADSFLKAYGVINNGYNYRWRSNSDKVEQAVEAYTNKHFNELLEADSHGKKIRTLERERDSATDAVYLATAAPEVRALQERLSKLIGQDMTKMLETAKGND